MPSGRTHDRITLWSLPWVAGISYVITQSGSLTLIISAGFLFSGLMFGPDLDLHSRQYIRWGPLRYIWIPYQKLLSHRSIWSHGFLIGTVIRILYLGIWLSLLGVIVVALLALIGEILITFSYVWNQLTISLIQFYQEWIMLFIGLELGAMSHYVSDSTSSWIKGFKSKRKSSRSRK